MTIRSAFWPMGSNNKLPFPIGTILFISAVGTEEIQAKLPKGVYLLEMVGAGGGYGGSASPDGHYWSAVGTGGGGAAFVGIVELSADVYKYKVGKGGQDATGTWTKGTPGEASYFIDLNNTGIITSGGDAASAVGNNWSKGGGMKGLINITAPEWIKNATLATDGNDGPSKWNLYGKDKGAVSVYYTYGEGSVQTTTGIAKGGEGYLKLVYLGKKFTAQIKSLIDTLDKTRGGTLG